MVGDKIAFVDRKELAGHTQSCSVKRRRATLGSDLLKDSRMRLRRITVRGSLNTSRLLFALSRVASYASENLGGLGAEPPVLVAYLRMGKFHFTLNQDNPTLPEVSAAVFIPASLHIPKSVAQSSACNKGSPPERVTPTLETS